MKDDRPWLGPGLILRLVSYLLEVTPILNFDESKFHLCAQESGLVVVCAHSEGFGGRGNAAMFLDTGQEAAFVPWIRRRRR